jgi:hypothetical protein
MIHFPHKLNLTYPLGCPFEDVPNGISRRLVEFQLIGLFVISQPCREPFCEYFLSSPGILSSTDPSIGYAVALLAALLMREA